MAVRIRPRGNRSRLGVPCLLEGARAKPRNRCSDRPACGIELNVSYHLATAEENDFVSDVFSGVSAKFLANYKYYYEEQSSIVPYRCS